MHDSVVCICSKSAFPVFRITPANLTDPDRALQACVGRTQMSRAKTLAPWAKGAQNGDKKGGVGVFL